MEGATVLLTFSFEVDTDADAENNQYSTSGERSLP